MIIYYDHNGVQVYSQEDGHSYRVSYDSKECRQNYEVLFQRGPVKEFGVNGLTNEALLSILANRIRFLNSGKFACRENSIALTKVEEALHWLEARTKDRLARGVEGENKL